LDASGASGNRLRQKNLYLLKRLDKVKLLRHTATMMRTGMTPRTLETRTISSGSIVLVLSILPL
jgi:hypothetical protein